MGIYDQLRYISSQKIRHVTQTFTRDVYSKLEQYETTTTVLIGERGVGKTTLVLQYLRDNPEKKSFYVSGDSGLIVDKKQAFELFFELANIHHIQLLAIDEAHLLPERQSLIKSTIDSFPHMRLILLGSSSLLIYQGTSALARRMKEIYVPPLSFGEYTLLQKEISLPRVSRDELTTQSIQIAQHIEQICSSVDLLRLFDEYVQVGMYPFFLDANLIYQEQLFRNLRKVLVEDIPTFINVQAHTLFKIEKIFYYLATIPPSEMSYSFLAKLTGVKHSLIESLFFYLESTGVIHSVTRTNKITDLVRKERKVFLGNPNLYHALHPSPNRGTLREAYVLQQLAWVSKQTHYPHQILLPQYGDFLFHYQDEYWYFEVGGKSKSPKQLDHIKQGQKYRVLDDIFMPREQVLPLWMFGLLGDAL